MTDLIVITEIKPYEERAMEIVVTVINLAKEKLGNRQTLFELARTATHTWAHSKISLKNIKPPFIINTEKFIADTIENVWKLTEVFMYHLKYMHSSKDETSQYYYFEAIFSQPTAAYPIPQATVSVYFRVQDQHLERNCGGVSSICFRIEGHHTDHDIHFVALSPDWLLAVLMMKLKFFKRLESLALF